MTTRACHRGFTLVELLIAVGLLALMSAVLFGSLGFAGRSWDAGEAKAENSAGMRLAGDYLRTQLASQHPQRMRKIVEFPLLFGGDREEVRFAAALPGRVGLGGMWYFRLAVSPVSGKRETALVVDRMIPDLAALEMPNFNDAERSVHRRRHQVAQGVVLRPRQGRERRRGAHVARSLGRHAAAAAADPRRRHAARGRPLAADRRRAARSARGRLPRLGHRAPDVRGSVTMRARGLRRSHARAPRRQRGIALILVLWLTMMLTVIASGFAFSMRSEAMSARNGLSLAQARATANGAVERMAFELSRPRFPTAWMADGQVRSWQDGDVAVAASAVDESARIDLNMAPEPLLKGLMERVGGAEPEVATRIVESLADWRDPDDMKRPNGAEEADYRLAGLKQKPANAPFETVNELARVAGMTEAIFARVADHLTVQSRQPGINAMTASREVLLALPNATRRGGRRCTCSSARTRSRRSCRCRRSRRRRASPPAPFPCGGFAPRPRPPMV